jgi:hypothetical protein
MQTKFKLLKKRKSSQTYTLKTLKVATLVDVAAAAAAAAFPVSTSAGAKVSERVIAA